MVLNRTLPTGTVTFLFTDLEGSTRLLQAHPQAYQEAVTRHHALLRGAVEAHGGVVFETVGEAVYAAFARPAAALAAALAGQVALAAEDWSKLGPQALRARMALHTGEVEVQGAHYFGAPLYRAGRLLPAAHGGQVVLSEATAALVRDALPAGAGLRDLGEHRLKDLQRPERVFQLVHPALSATFPPLATLEAHPHNLPAQLTSFVGRERELAEVRRLLETTRLLTLTGAGGCGKTRLALQAAAEVLEAYPEGAWLVELAPVVDPALVPQAVAAALGLRAAPGPPGPAALDALADRLRAGRQLLVLDNCEHLLDASAAVAEALLHACPGLRALATSRQALGISGETVWPVPPLSLPAPEAVSARGALLRYDAIRLFVERARAGAPSFEPAADGDALLQICRRLDGLPLAIELAAARVRVLSLRQIAARLDDRFRLLTGGRRTAPARHQTLRAAVDWSYDLLDRPERALFNRLTVFVGGWTLAAAEAVCAGDGIAIEDVLDLLARLVDKSLVTVAPEGAPSAPAGEARYRMLETLRVYGQERLAAAGEAEAVRRRHAAYYLARLQAAAPDALDPQWAAWLEGLPDDHDNVRAALRWSVEHGDARWWFQYRQARRHLTPAPAPPPPGPPSGGGLPPG